MVCVSRLITITAIAIKANYCNSNIHVCAKYQVHEIIAIDKEKCNLCSGFLIDVIEILEHKYSETYSKLCVRHQIQ